MMGHRQKLDGDGFDALTSAKRHYGWGPGMRREIKHRHAKRERVAAKAEIHPDTEEGD